MKTAILSVLSSLGVLLGFRAVDFGGGSQGLTGGPPITSNHVMADSSTVSSGNLSHTIMDLPGPGEAQDPERELDGTITNRTTNVRRIRDVKFWFEDLQGNILETPNGGAPVSELRTGNGSAGATHVAQLVGTVGGVATFNLADPVVRGASIQYDAQVDHFVEPNNFHVKMAFSQKKASHGKPYDIVGLGEMGDRSQKVVFDGLAPTMRSGVFIGLRNTSGTKLLTGAVITLISQEAGLIFTGGEVRDGEDVVVPGAVVTVSQDGRTLTVSGLALANPETVNLWLDLNDSFEKPTSFQAVGVLEAQ